jgi:hypothetical protein
MKTKKIIYLLAIPLLTIACSETQNPEPENEVVEIEILDESADLETIDHMNLIVLSDFGSEEELISDSVTIDQITNTMNSIDWLNFHQVIINKPNGDWIDVGGSLEEDGLSIAYQENNKEYVIVTAPTDIETLENALLSFHAGDGKFQVSHLFK